MYARRFLAGTFSNPQALCVKPSSCRAQRELLCADPFSDS